MGPVNLGVVYPKSFHKITHPFHIRSLYVFLKFLQGKDVLFEYHRAVDTLCWAVRPVCLCCSWLLTGIPILAVFQNLRWNSNKTTLLNWESIYVSFSRSVKFPITLKFDSYHFNFFLSFQNITNFRVGLWSVEWRLAVSKLSKGLQNLTLPLANSSQRRKGLRVLIFSKVMLQKQSYFLSQSWSRVYLECFGMKKLTYY